MLKKGCHTPWGAADYVEEVAPGIHAVETPSHGGYHLDRSHQERVKAMFPRFESFAGGPWYEEDCDWAIVPIVFPDCFPVKAISRALEIIRMMGDPAHNYPKMHGVAFIVETSPIFDRVRKLASIHQESNA